MVEPVVVCVVGGNAGVYILPFCGFYYSAIFSALQLFTELFFIGYSKFFVYLHPTPY